MPLAWSSIACLVALPHIVAADTYDPDSYEDAFDLPTKDYGTNTSYDSGVLDPFAYGAETGADDVLDSGNYYGDEFDEYYDTAGSYGDPYGEDYFYEDLKTAQADCTEAEDGKANLTCATVAWAGKHMPAANLAAFIIMHKA